MHDFEEDRFYKPSYSHLFNKINIQTQEIIVELADQKTTVFFSFDKSVSSQVDSLQFVLKQSKIEGKLPKQINLNYDNPYLDSKSYYQIF